MYGVRMSMHLGSSYANLMGNKASTSRVGRNSVQDEVWGKEKKKLKNKRKLPAYPLESGVFKYQAVVSTLPILVLCRLQQWSNSIYSWSAKGFSNPALSN